MRTPPPPELTLQPGDPLAATGTAGQLRTVEAACAGTPARKPAATAPLSPQSRGELVPEHTPKG